MRTAIVPLLLATASLAACDNAPSVVEPMTTARSAPEHLLIIGGVTWKAIQLPFVPTAINDAGTIAGYQTITTPYIHYQPVIWQNGVITQLATGNLYDYSAVPAAINANGVVAGFGASAGVVWSSATGQPSVFSLGQSGYFSSAAGVYDDGSVIGTASDGWGSGFAFRRSPTSGVATLPWGSVIAAADGAGNGYGSASDGSLIKWSAKGGITLLPIPLGASGGGYITGGDARGDVVGYASGAGPALWSANGTVSLLGGIPNVPLAVNAAGRLIGTETIGSVSHAWTSYKGALTILSVPDSAGARVVAVNSCGSILAQSGNGLSSPIFSGWLLIRVGLTPVCDQTVIVAG